MGELSPGAQAKLSRALEAKRITRLGDARERDVDIRFVAATNRDLEAERRAGRFRHGLLFRLSTAVIELPPLRHRPREVPILARLFVAEACARSGRPSLHLSPAALQKLSAYPWPGNARELESSIDVAVATGGVQTRAAELISMPSRTFALKLKQYGISVRETKRR